MGVFARTRRDRVASMVASVRYHRHMPNSLIVLHGTVQDWRYWDEPVYAASTVFTDLAPYRHRQQHVERPFYMLAGTRLLVRLKRELSRRCAAHA